MKPAIPGKGSTPGGRPRRPVGEPLPAKTVDGRRERSRTSRAKIVSAMMELVRGGEVNPSAAQVAEVAGVGLRSVFRLFDDMDTLYRSMAAEIEKEVMPIVVSPFNATDWKGRIREVAGRRAKVFELLLPFRISANTKRHESVFIMESHRQMMRLERVIVESIVPSDVLADAPRMHGLILALSFQAWLSLRQDQGLDVGEARSAILNIIEDVLQHWP